MRRASRSPHSSSPPGRARIAEPGLSIRFVGSGSSGNAAVLCYRDVCVLLDCGFGPRTLRQRLAGCGVDVASVQAVLITHEHSDHVAGLKLFARRPDVEVCATARTGAALKFGPRAACQRRTVQPGRSFAIGPFSITPFSISHDAADPVCYRFALPDGTVAAFATDLGYPNREALAALAGCDIVGLEANHDPELLRTGPYPSFLKQRISSEVGHLSNQQTVQALTAIAGPRLRQLFLMHLSQTNNRPDLALATARAGVEALGLDIGVAALRQDRSLQYPAPEQLALL
ncbi:MAG: MBL fold metallo-hydrolase [Deltaproteobacteria bacterium]|nr:MBL fold metallo-hydrolase [Deltaproteobacteria bacterium]